MPVRSEHLGITPEESQAIREETRARHCQTAARATLTAAGVEIDPMDHRSLEEIVARFHPKHPGVDSTTPSNV